MIIMRAVSYSKINPAKVRKGLSVTAYLGMQNFITELWRSLEVVPIRESFAVSE